MGKISKEEYALVKKQKEELLKLILEKTGGSRKELHRMVEDEFIIANLDTVTPVERKHFDRLVFGL